MMDQFYYLSGFVKHKSSRFLSTLGLRSVQLSKTLLRIRILDTHREWVYQGFGLNLGERSEIITILGSLLTTFEVSCIFWGSWDSSKNWLVPCYYVRFWTSFLFSKICFKPYCAEVSKLVYFARTFNSRVFSISLQL